jgi:hypothetical protein
MTMRSLRVTAQPKTSRPLGREKAGRDVRCSRPGAGAPSLVAGTISAGGAARYFPAHHRSESSREQLAERGLRLIPAYNSAAGLHDAGAYGPPTSSALYSNVWVGAGVCHESVSS